MIKMPNLLANFVSAFDDLILGSPFVTEHIYPYLDKVSSHNRLLFTGPSLLVSLLRPEPDSLVYRTWQDMCQVSIQCWHQSCVAFQPQHCLHGVCSYHIDILVTRASEHSVQSMVSWCYFQRQNLLSTNHYKSLHNPLVKSFSSEISRTKIPELDKFIFAPTDSILLVKAHSCHWKARVSNLIKGSLIRVSAVLHQATIRKPAYNVWVVNMWGWSFFVPANFSLRRNKLFPVVLHPPCQPVTLPQLGQGGLPHSLYTQEALQAVPV